jgi:hypothetical protein
MALDPSLTSSIDRAAPPRLPPPDRAHWREDRSLGRVIRRDRHRLKETGLIPDWMILDAILRTNAKQIPSPRNSFSWTPGAAPLYGRAEASSIVGSAMRRSATLFVLAVLAFRDRSAREPG